MNVFHNYLSYEALMIRHVVGVEDEVSCHIHTGYARTLTFTYCLSCVELYGRFPILFGIVQHRHCFSFV